MVECFAPKKGAESRVRIAMGKKVYEKVKEIYTDSKVFEKIHQIYAKVMKK